MVTAVVEDAKHPLSYLLVRKGSGLRGTAALAGKKVGILPTVAYRRWLEAVLKHDGVPLDQVSIMPIAPPLEVDTLAGGGVDALFTGDPMATAAIARGVAELATDTPNVPRVLGEPFLFGTFALAERTAGTPEAKKLVAALDEAIGILSTDPGAGRDAMKSYVRDPERAFVDRYPDTRYLKSSDVARAALDYALEQVGATVRAADVALP